MATTINTFEITAITGDDEALDLVVTAEEVHEGLDSGDWTDVIHQGCGDTAAYCPDLRPVVPREWLDRKLDVEDE
jgi:hypothetical protein